MREAGRPARGAPFLGSSRRRHLAVTIALWAVYCGWVIYRAARMPS